MESAKRAGYCSLWGGILFILFAVAFWWISTFVPPPLCFVTMFLFWITIPIIAVYLFYAVWGLACGYNQKTWDSYSAGVEKNAREGTRQACIEQGYEIPEWLEE